MRNLIVNRNRRDKQFTQAVKAVVLPVLLGACAADPRIVEFNRSSNSVAEQREYSADLKGALFTFFHSDYYSLGVPKAQTSCAGDAKTFYDPFKIQSDQLSTPFPTDALDPTATLKPTFIKNVSVDLTDANSPVAANKAIFCSLGTAPNVPGPSNCATFDYGAAGGLSTNLGGAFILIGGIDGANASVSAGKGVSVSCGPVTTGGGVNTCNGSSYALSVDSLPASAATDPPSTSAPGLTSASTPISSWTNLATAYGASGPRSLSGAAAAFSPGANALIIFGGASYSGTSAFGIPASDTWSFDLSTQKWTSQDASTMAVNSSLITMLDIPSGGPNVVPVGQNRATGARAAFAYTAAQGMAVNRMSTNGAVAAANIDLTDRIVIAGGVSPTGALTDTHKFNPTYGPEWVDTQSFQVGDNPTQWLDSYHTQLTSNSAEASQYLPDFPPRGGSLNAAVNFGITALRNNSGTRESMLVGMGGFDSSLTKNTPGGAGCLDLNTCGAMMLNTKAGADTAAFIGVPNLPDGTQRSPSNWSDAGVNGVPWFGGSTLLPGFNLYENEVVYFGGTDCKEYATNGSLTCDFRHPGSYWRFSNNLAARVAVGFAGSAPRAAGMAAARGLDGNTGADRNVIIVAWGGMTTPDPSAPGAPTMADPARIYYLYNNGGTPSWAYKTVPSSPTALTNAAMVFSHVTQNFYVFGGYNRVTGFLNPYTWELKVTGNCATESCSFSWRQLTPENGLTCYPNCPQARRSHRMVEANYYNRNIEANFGNANGESTCSKERPCSFGIFMEGGTDGSGYFTDRWLFDPTANPTVSGSQGQWIRMNELPPRTLAAISTADYAVNGGSQTAHRAILFGGEVGLHAPAVAGDNWQNFSQYFVAPTLGDTLMYDFDTHTWNRVQLLGAGYNGGLPASLSEFKKRQAFNAAAVSDTGETTELSPPPLAGAVMVTRTMSQPTLDSSTAAKPLRIPEIYLFGGRLKSGEYNTLDRVYKFCPGSTGETWNGLSVIPGSPCDANAPASASDANPNSPSPSNAYIGRWLRKKPDTATVFNPPTNTRNPGNTGSFLGAGAYDPIHDRIILVGGRTGTTAAPPRAVTDNSAGRLNGIPWVLEYTPPSTGNPQGSWAALDKCAGSAAPVSRYGHSLSYDPLSRKLIMVGGYAVGDLAIPTGTPLTRVVNWSSGSYSLPEVWTARRDDSAATPCYHWTAVTTFGNIPDSQVPSGNGLSSAAAVFVPASGYNTGYYTMLDHSCQNKGPLATTDPTVNKLLAGGAYIDIDRRQLGPNENLLLNLTYFALGSSNQRPDSLRMQPGENAVFKVHLIKTGQSADVLSQILQPRYFSYALNESFPKIAHTISILAPPSGQLQDEQVLIPLSIDPGIDRIRIERHSGSGILVRATLFKLGYR
ncbi:MAG TPA: hypothetical protein VJB59_12565 [Bdellovibrionota bacterium]|nr:hypothetical protein [Bdellovibrionota bacterium]